MTKNEDFWANQKDLDSRRAGLLAEIDALEAPEGDSPAQFTTRLFLTMLGASADVRQDYMSRHSRDTGRIPHPAYSGLYILATEVTNEMPRSDYPFDLAARTIACTVLGGEHLSMDEAPSKPRAGLMDDLVASVSPDLAQ